MPVTAEDEKARLESDVRRLKRELEQLRSEHNALKDMVYGLDRAYREHDQELRRINPSWRPYGGGDAPEDGKGWACLNHKPIQHRDAKEPWCNECGRSSDGSMIGRPRWLARIDNPPRTGRSPHRRADQAPAPVDSSGEHARCKCPEGERCTIHSRDTATGVIVGTEHHQFVPGADGLCDGRLGYAHGHPRYRERCGASIVAEIHALPPGWTSWGSG